MSIEKKINKIGVFLSIYAGLLFLLLALLVAIYPNLVNLEWLSTIITVAGFGILMVTFGTDHHKD